MCLLTDLYEWLIANTRTHDYLYSTSLEEELYKSVIADYNSKGKCSSLLMTPIKGQAPNNIRLLSPLPNREDADPSP